MKVTTINLGADDYLLPETQQDITARLYEEADKFFESLNLIQCTSCYWVGTQEELWLKEDENESVIECCPVCNECNVVSPELDDVYSTEFSLNARLILKPLQ